MIIDYQAKQATRKVVASALAAANPHLVKDTGNSLTTAAKNVRIELKAFPKVKFSVTTSRFAGGNDLRVAWMDGPTTAQVEAIVNKYRAGTFNGMDDYYTYETDAWNEAFGSAKYVSCNRKFSPAVVQDTINKVCEQLGGLDSIPTAEDYRMGRIWNLYTSGGCDVNRFLSQALSELSI